MQPAEEMRRFREVERKIPETDNARETSAAKTADEMREALERQKRIDDDINSFRIDLSEIQENKETAESAPVELLEQEPRFENEIDRDMYYFRLPEKKTFEGSEPRDATADVKGAEREQEFMDAVDRDFYNFRLPSKEEQIKKIAGEVRDEILSKYGDPAGHCIEASERIVERIGNDLGVEAVTVEGWCRFDNEWYGSDRPWDPHTWVSVPSLGLFIDATADQFNHGMYSENEFAPIIVQKGLPYGMRLEEPSWDEFEQGESNVDPMFEKTIYVAIFNYYGDYSALEREYSDKLEREFSDECSVSLVNGNTLCFRGLNGQEISNLMETSGADYNYSYEAPEDAWSVDEASDLDTMINRAIKRLHQESRKSMDDLDRSLSFELEQRHDSARCRVTTDNRQQ